MLTLLTAVSETVLTALGTAWTTSDPAWKAVLPVSRTRLKGVRRTSWVISCGDLTTLVGPRTGPPDTRDENNTNRTASWNIKIRLVGGFGSCQVSGKKTILVIEWIRHNLSTIDVVYYIING